MKSIVDRYLSWLKDNMTEKEIAADVIEVTTPYVDRNNDYTQIYIKKGIGHYKITDAGYIITDLELSGVNVLKSGRRKEILHTILCRLGLDLDESTGEIYTREISEDKIPLGCNRLLQGMLDVNDMFYLSTPNIVSIFADEVDRFFKEHHIYSTKGISYRGKSGYEHVYDYLFQKNDNHPGRVMRLMNRPSKENFERFVFAWNDIKEVIKENGDVENCLVLINDQGKSHDMINELTRGFQAYRMDPILWSERNNNIAVFS